MTDADALLALLRAALQPEKPLPALDAVDWQGVFKLAVSHRIEGLLLTPALSAEPSAPGDILAVWQQRAMAQMMKQIQITDALHELLSAFESAGLKTAVLKGIVLKALYPEPDMRVMSDADMLISDEQFEAGRTLLGGSGFVAVEDECHDDTFVCESEAGLRVELHRRLFDKKRQGFLAALDETALFPVSKAVRVEACGGEVWSLPPTEHALFLLLHMAKHMIVTGFGLRQVADFALFAERYGSVIEWQRMRGQCEKLSLMTFARSIMWICEAKLGAAMPAGAREWAASAAAPYIEGGIDAGGALLADVVDSGVFGKSSEERARSAAIVYRSFDRDGGRTESGFMKIVHAVFIRVDELHYPYLYAKRWPALLPVAWIHRLFRYAAAKDIDARRETSEGMRIAGERIDLLANLKMIK